MTEAPAFHSPIALKIKALELANGNNEPHDAVIKRATAYHAYLSDATVSAVKPAAGNAGNAGATTAAKPGATTTAKPQTPPAQKPAGAAQKPGATAPKPGANKPAGTNPAPAGGTSAEGLVMEDVTRALQTVLNAGINPKADAETKAKQKEVGKKRAYQILKDVADADSARNVKPDKYAAVIAACAEAIKKPAAKPAAAPAPEPSEFDEPADDENGAAAAQATEDDLDPPEHTGAGEDA